MFVSHGVLFFGWFVCLFWCLWWNMMKRIAGKHSHDWICITLYPWGCFQRVDIQQIIKNPGFQSRRAHSKYLNSGWWFQPLWKNISQLGWWFPICGKIKNVPNHQPELYFTNEWSSPISGLISTGEIYQKSGTPRGFFPEANEKTWKKHGVFFKRSPPTNVFPDI